MNIFMPIGQMQLGQGGAETQAHRLARALIDRGHRVEILTTRPAGAPAFEELDGVPVRRLFCFGNRRVLWRLGRYSYTASLVEELLRRRRRHDVVHAHLMLHPAWAGLVARRLGGNPVLAKVGAAGSFGDLLVMREGRPFLPAGSARMLRQLLDGLDAIVAISSAIAGELLDAGVAASRIARIPNGVDLPPAITPALRAEARESLGLDEHTKVVVYAGRGGLQKGSDLLVAAWRRLLARWPAASAAPRLFVLGALLADDPAFMSSVRELGASVTVTGRVLDVPRYLRAADLFVLPSRAEGLSNALLEAMAHGVPSLVSDLPANADLARHGHTALVSPVEDTAALADEMARALEDPAQLSQLGSAARRLVAEHYTLDSVARRYEALYEKLLSGRAHHPA